MLQNLMGNDGSWDQELLADLFNGRDRELINKIPLFSSVEDRLVWQLESSGIYSVKSAYNLLQVDHGRWHDNPDAAAKFWSSFWRLKLPPKIKNLVWRACRNCLPTLCQLRTKRVIFMLLVQSAREMKKPYFMLCLHVQRCRLCGIEWVLAPGIDHRMEASQPKV
ncbi:hypothetical protein F8388_019283 [Cannabis sativa]|uniref:Reverse transcriptase zinc-binding domain-containing protein n=1 Tax=Cannabis sativa TaxID=3483 RepID=A0A7J6FQV2_CANSA|nr:hypothetical protein F8388_019283 [Cannabis sativa]